jgi:DNA-binding response OmpR family regulator
MVASKVVVDIISPNARTRNTLEFALQQQGKGRFELSRGNRPDLVIVDCEKPETRADLRKFRRRFPNCPAILLMNLASEYDEFPEEDRIGSEIPLIKPFAVKDLLAAVDQCLSGAAASPADNKSGLTGLTGVNDLAHKVPTPEQSAANVPTNLIARIGSKVSAPGKEAHLPEKTIVLGEVTQKLPQGFAAEAVKAIRQRISPAEKNAAGSAPSRQARGAGVDETVAFTFAQASEIDLNDAAAVESRWLNTDARLLGHIARAITQQASAKSAFGLALQGGPAIYVDPQAETVAVSTETIDLIALAQQDFDKQQLSLIPGALPETGPALQFRLEAFLWKLALYTYRGLLPVGVQVNEPVYLRYWPNLTRFEPTPNAMRISSFWCRQPTTLATIIRMLNIPQRHVFGFYAAASTLRLAGPAKRESDRLLMPSPPGEGVENHTLIQGVASKLIFWDEVTS